MKKIEGVKSVDFKIEASGHGVVNWNGNFTLRNENYDKDDPKSKYQINNHSLPKMRGFNQLKPKDNGEGEILKSPQDINLSETPLYISQNCFRSAIFKDYQNDQLHVGRSDQDNINYLASLGGLIRGYMIAKPSHKRTSPLLIEDLVDQLCNGNFEQFVSRDSSSDSSSDSNSDSSSDKKKKGHTSFFSKTTVGDTEYVGYGSINIEELQFLPTDDKYKRGCMKLSDDTLELLISSLQKFLNTLNEDYENVNLTPTCEYHENYVRNGSIYQNGEAGILFNDDAIFLLVEATLDLIQNTNIVRRQGYINVDNIIVDYNDSNKVMRIKKNPNKISMNPSKYAVYYTGV